MAIFEVPDKRVVSLFEKETLFEAYRWRAYQGKYGVTLIAFNGSRGFNRDDPRGWEYMTRMSDLSEAVKYIINAFTGL